MPKLTTLAAAAMVVVLSFKCGKADTITATAFVGSEAGEPAIRSIPDVEHKVDREGGKYNLYTTLLTPQQKAPKIEKLDQDYKLRAPFAPVHRDFIEHRDGTINGIAYAKAAIEYGDTNWNSKSSVAEATWIAGDKNIKAIAQVTDPADYIVEALLPGEQVFLGPVFSGMALSAPTDPELGLFSYAEISGVFVTDLFSPGNLDMLWQYKWSASGSGGSLFEFQSDSRLGFDDAAIQSVFINSVSNLGGGSYVLNNNLSWDSDISHLLSQTGTTEFVLGGDVSLLAVAVPEPSTFAMGLASLACGGFALWKRRRRAR